jgi:hypothetical protein
MPMYKKSRKRKPGSPVHAAEAEINNEGMHEICTVDLLNVHY